ncbi:MAG: PmeII family type II restriction endonuclease [Blastocatellia bacterium]
MQTPEFYEEPNHEHNLIIAICQRAAGIGKTTAAHLASYLDTVAQFMNCQVQDLLAITKKNGSSLVKPEQANEIIAQRDHFLPRGVVDIRQLWITYLIRDFVERAIEEIRDTDFDKLLINPFLIRAFNFTDHREVITFCFYQKVTRSIVTSWGFTVERMLLVSGGIPIKGGFDILIRRKGKDHHLQIKSSPNTMDFDQVQNLNHNIRKLQETTNKVGMLGVTYGVKNSHLSSIMQGVDGYPENVLVGHELWDFVAQEQGYTAKVLGWASAGMPQNTDFSVLLENKRLSIVKDWETKYGTGLESIKRVLKRYL